MVKVCIQMHVLMTGICIDFQSAGILTKLCLWELLMLNQTQASNAKPYGLLHDTMHLSSPAADAGAGLALPQSAYAASMPNLKTMAMHGASRQTQCGC